MAKGRPRSTSNVSSTSLHQVRAPTASPELKRQYNATIDTIHNHNFTVLRRGDPTIVSILDSFGHVCLYHFNGQKWEKQGYEGSMFLVEHQDSPPYGFYILNRMGTADYCRRIYPEDDMEVVSDYLMYRYYPEFTKKRLELGLPYPLPEQYRPIFDREFAQDRSAANQAESAETSGKEKKGTSVTLGLWMFPSDVREPLKDVMIRLLSYIKKGQRYPDEYRYGPGRPPPPNPHIRRPGESHNGQTTQGSGSSEVDKLFAKLQPKAPTHTQQPPQSNSNQDAVQAIMAALNGQPMQQQPQATPSPAPSIATSQRGLALLDSIFASAQAPPASSELHFQSTTNIVSPREHLPPHPEEIQIVSPKPQSSALPQILNQNVITNLLGLGPEGSSRASSAAPSSVSSRRSGHKYEGDNELSESEASVHSRSSARTVDPAILAVGGPAGNLPSVSLNGSSDSDSDDVTGGRNSRIQGDVTPRVPARGIGPESPPPMQRTSSQQFLTPTNRMSRKADSTKLSEASTAAAAEKRSRTLVPFEADSELWPYPRAPADDREFGAEGGADMVELDFSDTRALSDPNIYSNRLQKQKKQKQNGKKKSKTEQAADRERERAAIENSWDDPTNGQAQHVDMTSRPGAPSLAPSSSAPEARSREPAANGAVRDSSKTTNGGLNVDGAYNALLNTLLSHEKAPNPALTRKQFVSEVLTLIYHDNEFVDNLYSEYTNRS
ncbi:hypothetical protein K474DRAFT_1708591 [Panus rudis PR-1116 ss-1]|nr:hypothetical protein K474DRAFT_1708591 [Panus rudis PR-1116 ss-1]